MCKWTERRKDKNFSPTKHSVSKHSPIHLDSCKTKSRLLLGGREEGLHIIKLGSGWQRVSPRVYGLGCLVDINGGLKKWWKSKWEKMSL